MVQLPPIDTAGAAAAARASTSGQTPVSNTQTPNRASVQNNLNSRASIGPPRGQMNSNNTPMANSHRMMNEQSNVSVDRTDDDQYMSQHFIFFLKHVF